MLSRAWALHRAHRPHLAAYRGVTELGALALSAEVCDWRRFPRATSLMGFCGLVPSEYWGRKSTRRGRITKAGNTHLRAQLVESAWSYQYRPASAPSSRNASSAARPTPWPGPGTPNSTCAPSFAGWLSARAHAKNVVTAIARELTGFLWAKMAALKRDMTVQLASFSARR